MLVFSTTKGISGLACALAHSRGYFDYDEKVSTYWPEFAQGGKEDITVRQLLSHQAGLCAIDEPMDLDTLADPDKVAAAIAKQRPAWEPCAKHGYHALTLGWYEGELLRRTDPQHRTIGRFFQEEIARPLGLEIYIGLPDEVPDSRIADIYAPAYKLRMVFNIGKLPRDFVKAFLKKGTITNRSFTNPKVLGAPHNYNRRDMRSIELPAANGIVQVRDVARLYGIFATGGAELGIKPETLEAIMSRRRTRPRAGTTRSCTCRAASPSDSSSPSKSCASAPATRPSAPPAPAAPSPTPTRTPGPVSPTP